MLDTRMTPIDGGTKEPRATLAASLNGIEAAQDAAVQQLSGIMMVVMGDDTPLPQMKEEMETPCLSARLEFAAWRMARITDAIINLGKALA